MQAATSQNPDWRFLVAIPRIGGLERRRGVHFRTARLLRLDGAIGRAKNNLDRGNSRRPALK